MSLSSSTLASLQKAGAAVFTADEKLKAAVKDYAQRVHAAMVSNPYGLGNNALFENWKMVARLSQTVSAMEEEFKKVYRVAAELTADDQPMVRESSALATPKRAAKRVAVQAVARVESVNDLTPTDVVVKPRKRKSAPVAAPKKAKVKASAPRLAAASGKPLELNGNAAKLMEHLGRILTADEFTGFSQTAAGKETGIALGSMTAAIKKALETGNIIPGPAGTFKLASAQPIVAA